MMGSMLNFHYAVHLVLQSGNVPKHVVDVGVYQGIFLDFWKHASERVTGFEPSPSMHKQIVEEYIMNQPHEEQEFLKCEQIGVSNFIGQSDFYYCRTLPAYSTTSFDRMHRVIDNPQTPIQESDFEHIRINVTTLDEHFLYDDTHKNILKVDSEDDDLKILYGAKNFIDVNRPLLQLEHIRYTTEQKERCDDFMGQIHYKPVKATIVTDNYYYVPREWQFR